MLNSGHGALPVAVDMALETNAPKDCEFGRRVSQNSLSWYKLVGNSVYKLQAMDKIQHSTLGKEVKLILSP